MKKLSKENLENLHGGNCFLLGAAFIAFLPFSPLLHHVDVATGGSHLADCWG